jgi:hypothetical protein
MAENNPEVACAYMFWLNISMIIVFKRLIPINNNIGVRINRDTKASNWKKLEIELDKK